MRQQKSFTTLVNPPDLTADQKTLIRVRQNKIREIVRNAIEENARNIFLLWSRRSGVFHSRLLSFVRLAMLDEGRWLLSEWDTIERELRIPWAVFYWEIAYSAWSRLDMKSNFYTADMSPTPEQVTASGEGWHPKSETTFPSLSSIPDDECYFWLGLIGGNLPGADHLRIWPHDSSIAVPAGMEGSLQFNGYDGVGRRTFSLSGGEAWMSVNAATGLVTGAPPSGTVAGEYTAIVHLIDGHGQTQTTSATFVVT